MQQLFQLNLDMCNKAKYNSTHIPTNEPAHHDILVFIIIRIFLLFIY